MTWLVKSNQMVKILVPLPTLDILEHPKSSEHYKCKVCAENPEFSDIKTVQDHRESGKHRFR